MDIKKPEDELTNLNDRLGGYLLVTSAICGALVMVVEVLGSRVIGPYFGVSLFVWTALITVTLLSLSAGYVVGGKFADSHPQAYWMFGLIILSGLFVSMVPLIKGPVIETTSMLGLRWGALASATCLFAPSLILLGCVSPFVVRIALHDWSRLGRTVGLFYAVSTTGSFFGTAITGFYLLAYVGVSQAFYLCGLILCLLGVGYFILFKGRKISLLALLPFLCPFFISEKLPVEKLSDGTTASLMDYADSYYGNIKIVDYKGADWRTREMMIDGLIQGGIDLESGQSVYEYAYLMESLAFKVKPDLKTALLIGLGPGVLANGFQQQGVKLDVVDIDGVVVEMAKKYFGFNNSKAVIVEDGRSFLRSSKTDYDLILMDVFNGDITPGHLLSEEAVKAISERLRPDGIFEINLISSLSEKSIVLPSIIRTLRTRFADVIAFPLFNLALPNSESGNIVLLASNVPLDSALALRNIENVHPLAADGVALALRQSFRLSAYQDALILTDDFNPLDVSDAELHESVRRRILETTPAKILVHG